MALPTGRQVDPLWVTFSGGGPGTNVTITPHNWIQYAEAIMTSGVPAAVFMYTVPTSQTLSIYTLIGWGDYAGQFTIKVDGVTKGGGRTSAAMPTLLIDYSAPILATAGQLVAVYGEEYDGTGKLMKINLIGELL